MEKKLNAKDWVLVRDSYKDEWNLAIYSHKSKCTNFHITLNGADWEQCIPYEGNEKLLGTKNDYVKPYEPKDGDFVYLKSKSGENYIFISRKGSLRTNRYCSYNLSTGIIYVDNCTGVCSDEQIIEIRLATEEEKNLMLSKLHETGKDWNAKTKEIELIESDSQLYVARDSDNALFLYYEKPIKKDGYWSVGIDYDQFPINRSLFPEVKWTDDEPTEVKVVKK